MPTTPDPRLDVDLLWGPLGARAVHHGVDVAVVVDVLSFTTTVSVAADRGAAVLPCPTYDDRAVRLAQEHDAVLAVRRTEARPGDVSLSPASVRAATDLDRLVLPSPNGSTLSRVLGDGRRTVVAACLRNATAVAGWLSGRATRAAIGPVRVTLVAAGERRADGTIRQAAEDVWGAGAVLDALRAVDGVTLSARASAARDAWRDVAGNPARALRHSRTGAELTRWGFASDVEVAAEVDSTGAVPVLVDGAYEDVARDSPP